MILTIVENYKSVKKPYANGFVHRRVLSYKKFARAEVFLLNKNQENYQFEDVEVNCGDYTDCISFIKKNQVKAICIHFLNVNMIKIIKSIDKSIPIFIFVHGVEALHWYQRVFPGTFTDVISTLKFIKYSMLNIIRMKKIQKFLSTNSNNIHLVAVSKWMAKEAEHNWKVKNALWTIIPNFIDTELFTYNQKNDDQKYKFLSIRPYSSGKYANDITVKLIEELSKYQEFKQFEFLIIGSGKLFNSITAPLRKYSNVKLENKFLQQDEIAKIHKEYGFFLCPTRQDAQGVSMCEAMSSGLVPISTKSTAIPEFLPDQFELTHNNVEDMARRIIQIINTPGMYQEFSLKVSQSIQSLCSEEQTTQKELELIQHSFKITGHSEVKSI